MSFGVVARLLCLELDELVLLYVLASFLLIRTWKSISRSTRVRCAGIHDKSLPSRESRELRRARLIMVSPVLFNTSRSISVNFVMICSVSWSLMVSSLVKMGVVLDKPMPLRPEELSSAETLLRSDSFLVIICKSFSSNLIPSLLSEEEVRAMDVSRDGLTGPGRCLTLSLGGCGAADRMDKMQYWVSVMWAMRCAGQWLINENAQTAQEQAVVTRERLARLLAVNAEVTIRVATKSLEWNCNHGEIVCLLFSCCTSANSYFSFVHVERNR